ncbi:MAG: peptidylprolyl isomerase [Myxococcota bacterium]|jgi:peptidylprolyl isomerase
MKTYTHYFVGVALAAGLVVGCGKKDDTTAEKPAPAKVDPAAKAAAEKPAPEKAEAEKKAEPAKAEAKKGEEPKKADEAKKDAPKAEGDKAEAKAEVAAPPADKKEEPKMADKKDGADPLAAPADVKEAPKDAEVTKSGLASKILKPGAGEATPDAADTVKVHYTGWTTDGKMFDSSRKRGEPTTFPLNGVIAGWTEGVALMKVGESRRFWIPEALAYKGRPGAPAGMLVFDVELLEIISAPKAPSDVAAPPAEAEATASGLASKILAPGTGSKKPSPTDQVTVHYSGWTTDGKMFDSSVSRGEPATFPLNRVIPGWTEGVGLMVEGEKRRLWIPEALAYKGRPGAPAGMLVFDVELLKIVGK